MKPPAFVAAVLSLLLLKVLLTINLVQAQQDPSKLNGGSCLAMAGKDCVALIMDSRFGAGSSLVNVQARHVVLPPTSGLFAVALQGLQGDVLTLEQEISLCMQYGYARGGGRGASTIRLPDNGNKDDSNILSSSMSPRSLASWTSHMLYQQKRSPYFVEPMIVGLERRVSKKDDTARFRPYLCSMDLLGSLQEQPVLLQSGEEESSPTFCCMGAAVPSLYGTAQAFWKPDMEESELQQTIVKAFLAALERDCLSGYGARLYMLSASAIANNQGWTVQDIITRND